MYTVQGLCYVKTLKCPGYQFIGNEPELRINEVLVYLVGIPRRRLQVTD